MRQASTSGLTFKDMRIRDKLYIDKTLLIKDLLDRDDSGVFLYTRPRRFGKSTNITMLDAFFNLRYKGNTWFDGLMISEFPKYDRYKNRFPVIKINLKDTVPLESGDGYSFLRNEYSSDIYEWNSTSLDAFISSTRWPYVAQFAMDRP